MSRARLLELAGRRARLIEAAREEREAMSRTVAAADALALRGLRLADGIQRVAAEVRARPLLALGAMTALAAVQPRRVLGWLLKGWSAWRMYRGARRWWEGVAGFTRPRDAV